MIYQETYQEGERRRVLQKAQRYAPAGVWKIKTPKRVLRCDVCQKYKKKQAVYACWGTKMLYCEVHVPVHG